VGGGLRTDEDIEALLADGVERAIVGTRAWQDPEALERLVRKFGSHIAVGIDARDGLVQVKGWVETTSVKAVDLARQVDAMGVETLIYTDTATDGMMTGVNAQAVGAISAQVRCGVVASGGITSVEDVRALKALAAPNLVGAIVGKALYEGEVTLGELMSA
jgi:phosphoribosylformimino-5-aminoimidazole carboxamide ribotide isomerase